MADAAKSTLGLCIAIGSGLAIAILAGGLYFSPEKTFELADNIPIKILMLFIGSGIIGLVGLGIFAYFVTLPARRMTTIAFRVFVFYGTLSVAFSTFALPRLAQLTFDEDTGASVVFEAANLSSYSGPNFIVCSIAIFLISVLHVFTGYLEAKVGTEL